MIEIPVKIEEGQVWFDNAGSTYGRKVKVLVAESYGGGKVKVEVIEDRKVGCPVRSSVGREIWLGCCRFGKPSGFTLESG